MKLKTKIAVWTGILTFLVITPMYWIQLYLMLDHIHATPLMWVMYWVQVPVALLVSAMAKFMEIMWGKMFNDDEFDEQ